MDIRIGKHGWVQVGGDVNPGSHGATIAKADGRSIEIRRIDPVREHVGDREAVEVGFPFWSKDGYFDIHDLTSPEAMSARHSSDLTNEMLSELKPESRAMAIAQALLDYGRGDPGPSGWAKDVVPERVKWWSSKAPAGWRFLADEDREFRQLLRENRSLGEGYDPNYLRGIQERAAKALGWSLKDVQSLSLASLREQVRPVSPKLVHELTEAIREMGA